uniref:AIG1-type G domain-containing protein n=1 Tax=Pygocentrus nattereri TaxID=42514 RepID=A0A3B4BXW9_PYGNA
MHLESAIGALVPPPAEEEFHQILKQIGGKGNVYLVGDVDRQDGECKCGLMQEFVAEVNGGMRATSDKGRAMHCAVVVFMFRHAYVRDKANHVSVREVLKDVRTRTEGHGVRPALLGLVHDHCESAETGESVELLEQMLRSVFFKHPHDSIWAGHFVPKAPDGVQDIRRHICKAVLSAQAAQSTGEVGYTFVGITPVFQNPNLDSRESLNRGGDGNRASP